MRLLILRHAKSARPPGTDDFDRPLCDQGKAAAPLIGGWISLHGSEPALVLCSSAKRSKDTLALLLPHFDRQREIRYQPELYLAGLPALLQTVQAAPALSPLLVVGHNPGLQEFGLALLARPQPAAARKRADELARKFPTAGLAVIDFRIDAWQALKPASGMLVEFVRPKALLHDEDQE
jgi:phosphohistidine phosphatase